jgi:hypothetical protein
MQSARPDLKSAAEAVLQPAVVHARGTLPELRSWADIPEDDRRLLARTYGFQEEAAEVTNSSFFSSNVVKSHRAWGLQRVKDREAGLEKRLQHETDSKARNTPEEDDDDLLYLDSHPTTESYFF